MNYRGDIREENYNYNDFNLLPGDVDLDGFCRVSSN